MILIDNVSKIYGNGSKVVDNITMDVVEGEFVFIVGTSGAGKSTLVKLLLKEVEPSEGKIYINDIDIGTLRRKEIPYFRRNIGAVFQDFRLLPNRTVYDNVAFAMQIVEASYRDIRRNVPAVLALVGLQKKARAYPNQLSGGEQQRTALARAIINKPPLLLADEPTGNLDPDTAWEIMSLLEDINERGTTVVVATHAKDIVDNMRKRVVTLRDGHILRDMENAGYDDENYYARDYESGYEDEIQKH